MSDAGKVLAEALAGKPVPKRVRTNLDGSLVVPVKRDYAAVDAARTKVLLQARVRPEVLERVDSDALKWGLSRSDYLTNIVMGQTLPSPVSTPEKYLLTIAGLPIIEAIATLRKRIEEDGSLAELLPELRRIQRTIVERQIALTPEYEAGLDARSDNKLDQWSDNETVELPRKRAEKRP